MEVQAVANRLRPGVGREPARENRRAWLPQQTRFCPVVEDVNKMGFLVYPALHDHEAVQFRRNHNQSMVVTWLAADELGQHHAVFEARIEIDGSTDVTVVDSEVIAGEAAALELLAAATVDLNTPAGTVGLRGAYGFATPEGWDTLFTSMFNELPRPIIPVLTARVATDGDAHESVFRYSLGEGQIFSAAGGGPIGQVFFVPREEVRIMDASPSETQRFVDVQRSYWAERATKEKTTNYGATFTYHHRDHQKARRAGEPDALGLLQDSGNGTEG